MKETIFDELVQPGRQFLGVEQPIICGAMTWVSDPALVASVCNAGGFGCLAAGNAPGDILEKQVAETRKLTDKPFGVNVITIAPAYKEHLQIVRRLKLPFVIFAGSMPRRSEVKMVKESGAKVLCFASTRSMARRMISYGADAIILEGMEAGGHVGHVTLAILLQEVLFETQEVPVFVAGGIATGKMCAHLFLMGAAGVQLGTRFVMSKECLAHERFKETFQKARARDAISTPQIDNRLPVVAVRALRNKGTDDFGALQRELLQELDAGNLSRAQAQKTVEEFWMGRLRKAVVDGDTENGSMMAGQSVGLVDDQESVREIIDELVAETKTELQRVRGLFGEH